MKRPLDWAIEYAKAKPRTHKRHEAFNALLPISPPGETMMETVLRLLVQAVKPKRHRVGSTVMVHGMEKRPFMAKVVGYKQCDSRCQEVRKINSDAWYIVDVSSCDLIGKRTKTK